MYSYESEDGPKNPSILVNIRHDDKIIGRFQFIPHSPEMYQVHLFPVLIKERGNFTRFSKDILKSIFEDMEHIQKLIALVPDYNIHTIKMAEAIGMRYEGRITEGHLHLGRMVDLEIYGISRGEVE